MLILYDLLAHFSNGTVGVTSDNSPMMSFCDVESLLPLVVACTLARGMAEVEMGVVEGTGIGTGVVLEIGVVPCLAVGRAEALPVGVVGAAVAAAVGMAVVGAVAADPVGVVRAPVVVDSTFSVGVLGAGKAVVETLLAATPSWGAVPGWSPPRGVVRLSVVVFAGVPRGVVATV